MFCELVRLVSVNAERPNHPSRWGGGSALWGVSPVGWGQPARGEGSHDNDNDHTYMTALGRFDLQSRSA